MKRILVVLAMAPMIAQAHDISVGTIGLSGSSNLGFTSTSTKINDVDAGDTTTFNLSTTGVYYVIPNLGVGLQLAYNSNENKDPNGTKFGVSTLLIGPSVAYDFPVAEKLSIGLQGTIGYASATATATGQADNKATGYGLALGAGVKYFFVKSFSVDAGVGYTYAKLTGDAVAGAPAPEAKTSGLGVNVGLSVYFGQ
jgi:opacity protein-like surface antigen